ncbi:hypothetical protein FHS39_003775 [Streptomyces olivoverticillatus]|uniref:Lipoprotein n=1 Tax=Streptomyces olivoverticillatus TaxID=66427 RepID=A0A7W7LR11_9ACTN|nr:hypothetical protein [Streptomyces olivoverticillatus]MBB4894717.1 hypothetical protein [Streptomyces olivoverticillatus]
MRPLTATLVAAAVAAGLLGGLLCGCADPGGLKVAGPAQTPAATAGPVYVAQAAGEPPLRRPASLEIGGSVRLTGMRWRSWGGPTAEAVGGVSGGWCLPACRDKPYEVRVTLGGLVRQDRSAYYSRATIEAAALPPEQHNELRDLRLYVPRR